MSPVEVENHLRIPVFLFTLLLFFQMITGLLLFDHHLGWSMESILKFYHLNTDVSLGMSFATFLQTAVPHLGAMTLISFLIIHFLAFVPNVPFAIRWWGSLGLAFFTLLDIFSGLFIIHLSPSLYWIKIVAFIGFQFFFFVCTIMMFLSFIPTLQSTQGNRLKSVP